MTAPSAQRDDIQGLRAIAVLAVIVFHLNSAWLPGGFIGVDIFFVISGFLMASIKLRQEQRGAFSFVDFYISRMRRIVPAYLMLLALVTAVMAVLLIPRDFGSYEKSLRSALYFTSNRFFAEQSDYFAPAAHELPLLHTWSLAVEMQFYAVLPFMLVVVSRRWRVVALSSIALAIVGYSSYRLAAGYRQSEYFSLLARIPEFLVGSLLAFGSAQRQWGRATCNLAAVAGVLLTGASLCLISEQTPFPGAVALLPCLGAALLIAAHEGVINRLLSCSVLVWIGALSYSLYLWHWPVLAGLRYFLGSYPLPGAAVAVFVLLTTALSWLSYRYVELPFRSKATAGTPTRSVVLIGAALGVMAVAHGLNPRLVAPLAAPAMWYADADTICHSHIVGDCVRGDRNGAREILLLGDSHGAHLNYFADVVGTALKLKIRVITTSSCLPVHGFDMATVPEWARPLCTAQMGEVDRYLSSADAVVIAGKWQDRVTSAVSLAALDHFIAAAATRKLPVLVLAQVPMLSHNAQRMVRFESFGLARVQVTRDPQWAAANTRVQRQVEQHANARFLNMAEQKIFADAPFEHGVALYSDTHHLNEIGARRYGEVAIPYFARWLATLTATR